MWKCFWIMEVCKWNSRSFINLSTNKNIGQSPRYLDFNKWYRLGTRRWRIIWTWSWWRYCIYFYSTWRLKSSYWFHGIIFEWYGSLINHSLASQKLAWFPGAVFGILLELWSQLVSINVLLEYCSIKI